MQRGGSKLHDAVIRSIVDSAAAAACSVIRSGRLKLYDGPACCDVLFGKILHGLRACNVFEHRVVGFALLLCLVQGVLASRIVNSFVVLVVGTLRLCPCAQPMALSSVIQLPNSWKVSAERECKEMPLAVARVPMAEVFSVSIVTGLL